MKYEDKTMKVRSSSILLLTSCFLLLTCISEAKLPTTTITISPGVKVEAELAYNDETRAQGLMFRESLPEDAGMLFVFPTIDQHGFWMRNTLIPLDLIWLNERKEIVYLVTAKPCRKEPCESYLPMQKAKYVLEVNAGFAKRHNLHVGKILEFNLSPEVELPEQ